MWGPNFNIARFSNLFSSCRRWLAVRWALPCVWVVIAAGSAACQGSLSTPAEKRPAAAGATDNSKAKKPIPVAFASGAHCSRLKAPPMIIGANVIDHPDDKDDDASNDGARGYGSAAARKTLDRLRALGLSGVVLPVEINASDVKSTTIRNSSLSSAEGRVRLRRMIDDAHDRGLSVTVIPHLLLDDDGWRGEMAFEGPALDAFFASYTQIILPIASAAEARCAETFSFAVEMRALTSNKASHAKFGTLIRKLRTVFSGGLTYSANWDEVQSVPFWQQLDGIGVNAFFPLARSADATNGELERRALAAQQRLLAVRQRENKPLWLLEVGFKAVPGSFVEPWLWPKAVAGAGVKLDERDQQRAYAAVAQAVRQVPAASGLFYWAVPSDPQDRAHPYRFEPAWGFSFLGKAAEKEVRALAASPPTR